MKKANSEIINSSIKLPDDIEDLQKEIDKRLEYQIFRSKKQKKQYTESLRRLNAHQYFPSLFLDNSTGKLELLANLGTGTGKTMMAINACRSIIKQIKESNFEDKRKIYIIGNIHSLDGFREELFNPMYGFISEKAYDIYVSLNPITQKEEINILKKSFLDIINKIFVFIGYQKFTNLYFENIQYTRTHDYNNLLEIINKGSFKQPESLLKELESSMIIIDEFQNLYNSKGLNSFGLALKEFKKHSMNTRLLGLSGTFLNSSPVEIIFSVSIARGIDLNPNDYFKKIGNYYKIIDVNKLKKLIGGLFIYYIVNDTIDYPEKIYKGKEIIYKNKQGIDKSIRTMKFVRCPMSELQYEVEKSLKLEKKEIIDEFDLQYTNKNFVIPDKNNKPLYKVSEIKQFCKENKDYLFKKGFDINITDDIEINGPMINVDNLKKWAAVHYMFIKDMIEKFTKPNVNNKPRKVLAYTDKLKYGGIYQYKRELIANGFVYFGENPTSESICIHCGKRKKDHKKDQSKFKPVYFMVLSGDIDKNDRSILNKIYNSASNIYGEQLAIILMTNVAETGYSFKEVHDMYLLTILDNMSKLHQVTARAIRHGSHFRLPKKHRYVNVHILVPSVPNLKIMSESELSYFDKVQNDYKIKEIESFIREMSLNCKINRDETCPKRILDEEKGCIPIEKVNEKTDSKNICSVNLLYGYMKDKCFLDKNDPDIVSDTNIIFSEREEFDIYRTLKYYLSNIFPIISVDEFLNFIKNNDRQLITWDTSWITSKNINNAITLLFKFNPNYNFININSNRYIVDNKYKNIRNLLISSSSFKNNLYNIENIKINSQKSYKDILVKELKLIEKNKLKSYLTEFSNINTYLALNNVEKTNIFIKMCQTVVVLKMKDYKMQEYQEYLFNILLIYNCIVFKSDLPDSFKSYIPDIKKFNIKEYAKNRLQIMKYKNEKSININKDWIKNKEIVGLFLGPFLYITSEKKFIKVEYSGLYTDNRQYNNIIGIYSTGSSINKKVWIPNFKLVKISGKKLEDKRKIETGIVCETADIEKIKGFLKSININIKMNTFKKKKSCHIIEQKLLEQEIKSTDKKYIKTIWEV